MNESIKHIIKGVILITAQVLIFNQLVLHDIFTPFVYIIIIIMLPFSLSHAQTIFISFGVGLLLDLSSGTGGMHASSCVFLGFLRPTILGLITPPGGYDDQDSPNIVRLGFFWFISYALSMILAHHLALIFLDRFSLAHFWSTIARVLGSGVLTMAFAVIYAFLFAPRKA
jgi:rod shape-determining protein MreD